VLDLEEESFDEPLLNAQSALQMSELEDQLAKLRPQMELASQNARKAAEQMQKTFCEEQRKMTAKAKQEADKQSRQFKREQEKLKGETKRQFAILQAVLGKMDKLTREDLNVIATLSLPGYLAKGRHAELQRLFPNFPAWSPGPAPVQSQDLGLAELNGGWVIRSTAMFGGRFR